MEVDETTSVSKGVFVFKNCKLKKLARHKQKCAIKSANTQNQHFKNNVWYTAYWDLWNSIEEDIEDLNNEMFSSVLKNLLFFIDESHKDETEFLPTGALLTGVNMPDHAAQFSSLCKQIKKTVSPHVACLYSKDCQNIKHLIENMMDQFVNDVSDTEDEELPTHIKKSNMNILLLQSWYNNLYQEKTIQSPKKLKTKHTKKSLVVIFPEFESLNIEVIQKFLLIASGRIHSLPFIIIFGIATSTNTLTNSLPYRVISRMNIKVFHSQRSTLYLNKVLENVFLHLYCPFHLGGKVFNLFMDIFLFYDLSVSNFIQNIKFAVMEHFCHGNAMALCNLDKKCTAEIIENFDHDSLENVRHLKSFRKLVESESYENRIKLLTDDEYFRSVLNEEIVKIQKYIRRLHMFLECLFILVADLPKAPLGNQLRELYPLVVSQNITRTVEYKECFQLLNFQSKEELCSKLKKIVEFLSNLVSNSAKNKIGGIVQKLNEYIAEMNNFDMEDLTTAVNEIEEEVDMNLQNSTGRKQFREKLIALTKQENKSLNKYEKLRKNVLEDLSRIFEEYLIEPSSFHFYEIFFFDDISIQNYIVGTHRAAIHNALNDPYYYLQCKCCQIPNSSVIKPLMPDICIAYKLHLECGKLINLFDWLQAFLSVVDSTERDEEDVGKFVVDSQLQARFTQAVTELEFLGFIKSSKRKADHVTRLTWGG